MGDLHLLYRDHQDYLDRLLEKYSDCLCEDGEWCKWCNSDAYEAKLADEQIRRDKDELYN